MTKKLYCDRVELRALLKCLPDNIESKLLENLFTFLDQFEASDRSLVKLTINKTQRSFIGG